MSDPFTVVIPASAGHSHASRGHVTRQEALIEAARAAKAEITRWQGLLADIKAGNVTVYQQTGLYRVKNRTELKP